VNANLTSHAALDVDLTPALQVVKLVVLLHLVDAIDRADLQTGLAAGAIVGGLCLILLPERIFEFLVPILLVFASLTMLIKPRAEHVEPAKTSKTLGLLFGSGIYNGYFGPGQGVLAVAVLFQDGRLTVRQVVIIKNLILATSNVVVAFLFIATGHVVWPIAIALLTGVTLGGWFGGKISGIINPVFTRWAVASIGFASALWFIVGR
jgi:uncharacterized membrane protein YfcA